MQGRLRRFARNDGERRTVTGYVFFLVLKFPFVNGRIVWSRHSCLLLPFRLAPKSVTV